MADIVLINPRFEASYWGLEYAMPLLGKRANLPSACLPLLAALTLSEHTITLLDENVTELDFDQISRADIVGVTGMSVQRFRMMEILRELKRRDLFVVVGGPWVTVREDYFGNLADAIFVGEAEETWPLFLRQWGEGKHQPRYEQAQKTDMTKQPCPRYDLMDIKQYLFGSLQIFRGCPFQCEFCDIIVTFGRRPRLKNSEQVLNELDAMHRVGMEIAFIVDDNLIGNKKAIKPILQDIVKWQKQRGYPFAFFAEASIDLADDPELMEIMVDANAQAVFIGVETPNEESLRETKKFQNLRSVGTIIEKIHRIQAAGIETWTGMIVGFDNDSSTIFDQQLEFVKTARIVHSMSGMLSAIPKTPLYDRLAKEGRLDLDDMPKFGTNVVPKQMSREALRDGYLPRALTSTIVAVFLCVVLRCDVARGDERNTVRVSTREQFAQALSKAEPGTTMLLGPGPYRGGFSHWNLQGTREQPIVIAAADSSHPPVFEGGASGLQLSAPAYVELRHLVFTGASGNGLNIDDGGSKENPAHHIRLIGLGSTDCIRGR